MILSDAEFGKAIDSAVFPNIQGGPLMHVIAGKAVMLKEAATPEFRAYAKQIRVNATTLAASLARQPIATKLSSSRVLITDCTTRRSSA